MSDPGIIHKNFNIREDSLKLSHSFNPMDPRNWSGKPCSTWWFWPSTGIKDVPIFYVNFLLIHMYHIRYFITWNGSPIMQNGLRTNRSRPKKPWYRERHPEDHSLKRKAGRTFERPSKPDLQQWVPHKFSWILIDLVVANWPGGSSWSESFRFSRERGNEWSGMYVPN